MHTSRYITLRLALSLLLSWSMMLSAYIPVASAFADEVQANAEVVSVADVEEIEESTEDPAEAEEPAEVIEPEVSAEPEELEEAKEPVEGSAEPEELEEAEEPVEESAEPEEVIESETIEPEAEPEETIEPEETVEPEASIDPEPEVASDPEPEVASDPEPEVALDPDPDPDLDPEPLVVAPEDALALVYAAASQIYTADEQQIAFLLADEEVVAASATLMLSCAAGIVSFECANCLANGLLFNLDTDMLGVGIAHLSALDITFDDATTLTIDFALSATDYSFEVLQPEETTVGMSVYTIDTSGALVEAADIEDALEAADAPTLAESLIALASTNTTSSGSDISTGLVIALDPGHDSNVGGATGQGLYEEELNLKIALYCRDELETYSGVTVYMTHETLDCPYPDLPEADCLRLRVEDAVAAGAVVFISFHLDASTSSSVHGVSVWYPNTSLNAQIAADGKELAESIQAQLVALGIYDRGTKENGTYDEDNDLDYYSVIRNSKINGIPGVIIEHCFITGSADYQFISSDAALKALGVADATGIANYFGLSKTGASSEPSYGGYVDVSDVDGVARTVTLRASGVYCTTGLTAVSLQLTLAGTTTSYDLELQEDGPLQVTIPLPSDIVAQEATLTGYLTDATGEVFQFAQKDVEIKRFSDLVVGEWYLSYVDDVVNLGLMVGYTDGDGICRTFGPEDPITRAQVVTILYRLANPSSDATTNASSFGTTTHFSDVETSLYYTAAVEWAYQNGIVMGDTDAAGNFLGIFRPEDSITREELATMLYRYAQACGVGGSVNALSAFPDASSVSSYATAALGWCNARGIITGNTATNPALLLPQDDATRAEAAKMFDVFYPLVASQTVSGVSALSALDSDEVLLVSEDAAEEEDTVALLSTSQTTLFSDTPSDAWYVVEGYLTYVVESGLMIGDSNSDGTPVGTFRPEDSISRAEAVTILYRAAHSDTSATIQPTLFGTVSHFSDVASGQYYTAAVEWAYHSGIVMGDTDAAGNFLGIFRPDDPVTREELATMLYRYAQACGVGGSVNSLSAFPDAASASSYAISALGWCNARGIITGNTATDPALLLPRDNATRAEAAKMLCVLVRDVCGAASVEGSSWYSLYAPSISSLSVTVNDASDALTFSIPSGSVEEAGNVSVAIRDANSSDGTVVWYQASYQGSGAWSVSVPLSAFADGTYTAQVWAQAPGGTLSGYATFTFEMPLHPIMATSDITADELAQDFSKHSTDYPEDIYADLGAATIEEFCQIIIDEASAEGVDPRILYVQIMLETGYLKFGGSVSAEQCNFGGLGASSSTNSGASFETVQEGIRAQVQHLKAYASTDELVNELVDPRFDYVSRGCSPYLEGLGTRWSSGSSYGWNLVTMLDVLS